MRECGWKYWNGPTPDRDAVPGTGYSRRPAPSAPEPAAGLSRLRSQPHRQRTGEPPSGADSNGEAVALEPMTGGEAALSDADEGAKARVWWPRTPTPTQRNRGNAIQKAKLQGFSELAIARKLGIARPPSASATRSGPGQRHQNNPRRSPTNPEDIFAFHL